MDKKFAIWLYENRWFSYDKDTDKWRYTFEHGTSLSKKEYEKNYTKTTDELFNIFLEEQA